MANADDKVWFQDDIIVDPLETKNIDTIPLNEFKSIQYMITVWDDAVSKFKTLQMTVIQQGSDVNDSIRGKMGTGIAFCVEAKKSGSDMNLEFINQENFNVNIHFAKAPLGDI